MTRMFESQLGKTIEVYVDDMIVKSKVASANVEDLNDTFQTLRKYKLRLNASKCSFSVGSIVALTQLPLKSILRSVDYTGRIAKWGTMLGDFDIKYMPHTSVKGQVLADLVAEFVEPSLKENAKMLGMDEKSIGTIPLKEPLLWKVYVDGAVNQRGSGVGLVVISLERIVIEKFLRLNFSATNNEAEFEALLVRTTMVQRIGGKIVEMFSDSRLVMGQVTGELEARDPRMQELSCHISNVLGTKLTSNIVGPFPKAAGNRRLLLVGTDYFIKWVKTKSLSNIRDLDAKKFVWRNIVTRFGVPRTLISDNGLQFDNKAFKRYCCDLGITNRYSTSAYPQGNRQAKAVNKVIMNGLKKRLDEVKEKWVEELPHVLWTYHTTPRRSTRETSFSMTYGAKAVIPLETGFPTLRTSFFTPNNNDGLLEKSLDLIEERR
ncbi:uncharacterized protein LOC142644403 [Castanea sativa]|uniref:uncharacterized protein LOC142644403 n=1 Tax=Castanea sativa TaxID=21020 RepID=UPI003F653BC1